MSLKEQNLAYLASLGRIAAPAVQWNDTTPNEARRNNAAMLRNVRNALNGR